MNRRSFFRFLTKGAIAAWAAPYIANSAGLLVPYAELVLVKYYNVTTQRQWERLEPINDVFESALASPDLVTFARDPRRPMGLAMACNNGEIQMIVWTDACQLPSSG